ncbi:MAG: 50S ribosomal protein L4 [candidate division WS6 bacterium OLB20]|uniref:50S ribosomal protein L4 n=1 Tax=candidate division WS6 bacterium OLB20 TaxID=1617426 RepID=A0A136LWZ2_9BACT|nr:MAG: 50S ribosomal protein L4 [candidate division WS6 bacterium OLB20]
MQADTFTKTGAKAGTKVTLPAVFEAEVNNDLLSQTVYIYLSNQREANAHSKKRGEVSGGGKKPGDKKVQDVHAMVQHVALSGLAVR